MIFPSVRFPHELAVDNAHQLCLGLLLTVRTRQKPGRRFSGCSGLVGGAQQGPKLAAPPRSDGAVPLGGSGVAAQGVKLLDDER